jgi:hypothetical protein
MSDAVTWVAAIGPITAVGGTVGGYWFAGRNEEKRDERTAVREAAARRAAESDRQLDELNTGCAQAVELLGEHLRAEIDRRVTLFATATRHAQRPGVSGSLGRDGRCGHTARCPVGGPRHHGHEQTAGEEPTRAVCAGTRPAGPAARHHP